MHVLVSFSITTDIMKLNAVNTFVIYAVGFAYAAVIEVSENSAVTISCDLNVQYPTWTGPGGLADPLTSGQTINEAGVEWVNNKDLTIENAMLKHDGNYTCSDNNGNSNTVEVDVQYFSAWAEISVASPQNTTAVFTCECHSNPPCKIVPHVFSHNVPDSAPTHTTFNPCEPDPTRQNRMKCSTIATLGMAKEYNGLHENSCKFSYKGTEDYMTTSPENKFYFPPTFVNITGEKDGKTVTLNCTTDSSNPVAVLNWYKGDKDVASDNFRVISNYQKVIVDAEYHGKNITQSLDINVDDVKDGEKAFCCAKQVQTEICDSFLLTPFRETWFAYAAVIEVSENFAVTISCDLNVQYSTWTGPGGPADPLTSGQTINEAGVEWVNNKDLPIENAMLKHDGNYTCSANNGNSKTVEVDVQYFSAWAEISVASPQNTTAVFTCECHSNPPCKIFPHVFSHVNVPDSAPTHATFNLCEPLVSP
ncbi:uncharacterized protein LOC132716409 isoform X3 [Ruditapes philippinarum]|uniref:uncharacterized protein LOC132716409 isoform X3 n=1 Tax=Ruditapes philippinarum TaxID=129788 RepID=UPI00295A9BE8|nr:uncharacterized protein LOC132716409 isoform X3 [Ruditapes philippinarum]